MKRWFNINHLNAANTTYWSHAYYSLKEALVLLVWSILSVVHAFIFSITHMAYRSNYRTT